MENKLTNKRERKKQIVIIGGGPAGISAAIHFVRCGIDFILISENIGGTIRNANKIENLLGFPQSISGSAFVDLLRQQVETLQIPYLSEKVISLKKNNQHYEIECQSYLIHANYVIIATGTIPRTLNVDGEKDAVFQDRLFYEVSSIQKNLQDKSVIIIGSGDIAYDYALNLQSRTKSILILQRSKIPNSIQLLQERISQFSNIHIQNETSVIAIRNAGDSVQCVLQTPKGEIIKHSDLILVAIGRLPNLSFLSKEFWPIPSLNKPIESIKFVGDVNNGIYRQVSIAMGEGMKVAMEISQIISHKLNSEKKK